MGWTIRTDLDTADGLAKLLSRFQYRFRNEQQLHAGIAKVLTSHGVPFQQEVLLTENDRIDFMAGMGLPSIGIEVKVNGRAGDVQRQLARYAASPRVYELLLVTTRPSHRSVPKVIGGKRVTVLILGGAL